MKTARNALFPAVFTIFIPFSGDRACIKDYVFIDPPYNTGNDFIYADDFMRSQDEENRQMGMYDEDENRLFKNNDSNGRFHSDWCSIAERSYEIISPNNTVLLCSIPRNGKVLL